jgi:hypothetical protein
MGTYVRKFHAIHYVFKYKYLVPFIRLGKKLIGKGLVKSIPEGHHNRNIKVFDDAFESAIEKWHIYYLRNNGLIDERPDRAEMLRRAKDPKNLSGQSLRDIKEIVNTMYLYDTAYREFMNILMHEIAAKMHEEYKPESGKTGHLLYTCDPSYEVVYYTLERIIRQQVDIGVANTEELLKPREKK